MPGLSIPEFPPDDRDNEDEFTQEEVGFEFPGRRKLPIGFVEDTRESKSFEPIKKKLPSHRHHRGHNPHLR